MLNASRYNYMTRISNGFQLKLERENVFYDYYNTRPPADASAASPADGGGPIALDVGRGMLEADAGGGVGRGPAAAELGEGGRGQLPRTAAAMLELDHAQRTRAPLDPVPASEDALGHRRTRIAATTPRRTPWPT